MCDFLKFSRYLYTNNKENQGQLKFQPPSHLFALGVPRFRDHFIEDDPLDDLLVSLCARLVSAEADDCS